MTQAQKHLNIRVTYHFTYGEFLASDKADELMISNVPPDGVWTQMVKPGIELLAPLLEVVRALLGGIPLDINSGYRCYLLNEAVGGDPDSQHRYDLRGSAVDFTPSNMPCRRAWDLICSAGIVYDQLIYEVNAGGFQWIHISMNDRPRKHSFTMVKH